MKAMRPGSRRGKRSKQASVVTEDQQVRLSGRARSPREMEVEEPAEKLATKPEEQETPAEKEEVNHSKDTTTDEIKPNNKVDADVEIKIDAPNSIGDKEDEKETKATNSNSVAEIKLPPEALQTPPPPTTPPRPMVDPLTPIESPAARKPQDPSEHGSVRGDEEDAETSSPLTERSLASDALMVPKSLLPESLIKKATHVAEKPSGAENIPKVMVERSSPAPSEETSAPQNGQLSDSSSLSELEDDSEAETERLDTSSQRTPRKKTATLVIRSSASSPSSTVGIDSVEALKSPSKVTVDGDANEEEEDDDEAEAADEEEGDAEAKTTEPTTPDEFLREPSTGLAGKKRKRSFGDFGESDQDAILSAAKDNEDAASVAKDEDADGDTAMKDEDSPSDHGEEEETPTQEPSLENGIRDTSRSPSVKEEETSRKSISPKPKKRKNKKTRTIEESSNGDDDPPEESLEATGPVVDEVDDDNADAETETGVGDNDQDNSHNEDAADAEMLRIKKAAAEDMTSIELIFAQLRDKIVEERVGEIDREIEMINDGTHPELILMSRAIQERRDRKIHLADTLIKYQREAHERETTALKAHVHAQYSQDVRQIREDILSEANEMWYAIHKERRAAEMNNNEFIFKVPRQTSVQYKHRAAYNSEVSLLASIAKYVGFPAAPGISGASLEDTRTDLEAMGLSSRIPQLFPQQQPHQQQPQPIQHLQNQPPPQLLIRPQIAQNQQPHPLQQPYAAAMPQTIIQQQPQHQQALAPVLPAGARIAPHQQAPQTQASTSLTTSHHSAPAPAAPSVNQKTATPTKRNEENKAATPRRQKTPVSPMIAPHPVSIRQYIYQAPQSPEQTRAPPPPKQMEGSYESNHRQAEAAREYNGQTSTAPSAHFVQQPQPQQAPMHLASLLQDPIKMEPSSAPPIGQAPPPFNTLSPIPNRVHSADSRNHVQQQHQPLPPLMKHGPTSPPPQQLQQQHQRDIGGPVSIHGRHSPSTSDEKIRSRMFAHEVGSLSGPHLDRRVKEEINPVGPRFGPPLGRSSYA